MEYDVIWRFILSRQEEGCILIPVTGGPKMGSATAQSGRSPNVKGRPKKSERNDATCRVDATLLIKAKLVADARGVTIAEYVSELIRNPVDRDFAKEVIKLGTGDTE